MTQPTESTGTHPAPPADLPWGISYLREDIQDLRQELRHEIGSLRTESRDLRAEIATEFRAMRSEMNGQLQTLRSEMNARFARIDTRFWLQTALILSSWVSLVSLAILR